MTTDTQLQLALAKMLPERLIVLSKNNILLTEYIAWQNSNGTFTKVKPTEWEHIVRLAEETLKGKEIIDYIMHLLKETGSTGFVNRIEGNLSHSSWDEISGAACFFFACAKWETRAAAILKVKGVL